MIHEGYQPTPVNASETARAETGLATGHKGMGSRSSARAAYPKLRYSSRMYSIGFRIWSLTHTS